MKLANNCHLCELSKTRKHIVWGEGPTDAGIMIIGEAPGKTEDKIGRPFVEVAKAGGELTAYLRQNQLNRKDIYITNLVKCHIPDDESPSPEHIKTCSYWLEEEIKAVNPKVIICAGKFSTSYFIPDMDMEMIHGIGYRLRERIIVPVYHPAAGLHRPEIMALCQNDFQQVAKIWRGQVRPKPDIYWDKLNLKCEINTLSLSDSRPLVAIDTEWAKGSCWAITVCWEPGTSFFVSGTNTALLATLKSYLNDPKVQVILHNALYDLPVLNSLGLYPRNVIDTMILAYLLQDEPQGLKPLAYRVTGAKMRSYEETIFPARQEKAYQYLSEISERKWAKPEPYVQRVKGVYKVKQPWPIERKAKRILADFAKNPSLDLRERWLRIDWLEGRSLPEIEMGPMPDGELSDIPFHEAVQYACQDASMTLRVYHHLWQRIVEKGLEGVYSMDIAILPMLLDMMRFGIKADANKFDELTRYYTSKKDELHQRVIDLTGEDIQLGSHQEVRKLLFKDLKLSTIKYTKTGLEKVDDKVLAMLEPSHPVVKVIRDWRGYDKLINTYSGPMRTRIANDGRIHPRIKLTRTDTGRLATAEPNLMAVPNQDEEGRKMREGFIAEPGFTLLEGDYSQIELRILAVMAAEPTMIETFVKGKDIHTMTACEVFGLPESQIDKYKHRIPCKRVNFGIPYGTEAQGLRETLIKDGADPEVWTLDACEDLIKMWMNRFSKVRDYIAEIHAYARRNGYVKDMFGRLKLTPGVYSPSKWIVAEALRQAQNMPIQASAQGVIKRAMAELIPIYRQLRTEGVNVKPLIQIHDALLWEVPEEHVELCKLLFKGVMENTTDIGIPTPVDFKTGPVWGLMKEDDE